MNYIFSSDIHGTGSDWIDKVERMIELYPEAKLIFGGDYIDGRNSSKETLEYIIEKNRNHGAIALKGNHEELFLNAIDNYSLAPLWFANGGHTTIKSLTGEETNYDSITFIREHYSETVEWLRNLPYIYETENIIFVHAGLDLSKSDPVNMTTDSDKVWIRDDYIYSKSKIFAHNPLNKTIVTGHTPTFYISGSYDDGRELGSPGIECPVVTVQYEGEFPRIFTDGGCKSAKMKNSGNVICINENGQIIKIL